MEDQLSTDTRKYNDIKVSERTWIQRVLESYRGTDLVIVALTVMGLNTDALVGKLLATTGIAVIGVVVAARRPT